MRPAWPAKRVFFWAAIATVTGSIVIASLMVQLPDPGEAHDVDYWVRLSLSRIGAFVKYITNDFAFFIVVFALISYFPMSYHAYDKSQAPERFLRLKRDFGLLYEGTSRQIQENLQSRLYGTAFFPHLLLTALVTFVGTYLVFKSPAQFREIASLAQIEAMRYGFIGAYLFSAQLVYRRYTTRDLHPSVYMYCSLTIIAGLFFNYVAFGGVGSPGGPATDAVTGVAAHTDGHAAGEGDGLTGFTGGVASVAAFALGYFPGLAIAWFNRVAARRLGTGDRAAEERPLAMLQGISRFHEARLHDLGIDNIQNVATADIQNVLLNTTFSAQEVVDWIDQALLILHLDKQTSDSFRRSGIRSASDYMDLWKSFDTDDEAALTRLAEQLGTTPERLRILSSSIEVGPNVHHVKRYWKAVGRAEFNSLVAKD